MPAEFDHARSFGRVAAGYAASRPTYPAELFGWIAANAPGRDLAVDVAAGGGQGTGGLLAHFAGVIAVDHSAELLGTISDSANLRTVTQNATELDVGGGADVLTVFQALHWFAGDAFWARVQETLKPGGLFVVVGYAWFTVIPEVDTVLYETLLPALAPYWSEKNQLLLDGNRGMTIPFTQVDTPDFAISVNWTVEQLLGYLGTWSAVTRMVETGLENPVAAVESRLRAAWGTSESRLVTMPLSVRAFRV